MITRRNTLSAAALLAGPPAAAAALLTVFTDPAAAATLGRHALATLDPGERHAPTLAATLAQHLAGPGPLRARIAAAAHQDFIAGRVLHVDGWILAATEARLCALAALQHP